MLMYRAYVTTRGAIGVTRDHRVPYGTYPVMASKHEDTVRSTLDAVADRDRELGFIVCRKAAEARNEIARADAVIKFMEKLRGYFGKHPTGHRAYFGAEVK